MLAHSVRSDKKRKYGEQGESFHDQVQFEYKLKNQAQEEDANFRKFTQGSERLICGQVYERRKFLLRRKRPAGPGHRRLSGADQGKSAVQRKEMLFEDGITISKKGNQCNQQDQSAGRGT